jgi:hypothetical protein
MDPAQQQKLSFAKRMDLKLNRFFSGKEDKSPAALPPSLQETALRLDQKVSELEAKIARCGEDVRQQVAKGHNNVGAKQRAVQSLKRKKKYQQQLDQVLGTQFNVDNLAMQQEQLEISKGAFDAMVEGQRKLKGLQADMSLDKVEQIMDDIAEATEAAKEIQDVLAQNSGVGAVDEDELALEWTRIQEEVKMEKLVGIPAGPEARPVAPPHVAVPTPADVDVKGDYARLLAAMSDSAQPAQAQAH